MIGCNKRYTDPSSLRKHVKNHSKEEQEQVKMGRDTGSQGRSTDNSMEGWLDTGEQAVGPNLALLCPLIGQHTGTPGAAIGQSPAPGYTEDGASGQYDQQCRRPDMASIRRGESLVTIVKGFVICPDRSSSCRHAFFSLSGF